MKTIALVILSLMLCVSAFADIIPGLMPVDIYLNLEEKGFVTEKNFAASTKKEFTEFICRKNDGACNYTVIIYIPSAHSSQVTAVSGVVENLTGDPAVTDRLSAPFLSYLATLKYDSASPVEAKIWVAASIGNNSEKLFGPVKMETYKEGDVRVMRMSTEPLTPKVAEGTAPAIKHMDPEARGKNTKIPAVGATFFDVQSDNGNPVIKDPDTGWATWPKFKVLFKDGRAAEVLPR